MSAPRNITIAALATLGVLLAGAFFMVYFGENDPHGVELTSVETGAAGSPGSGRPPVPTGATDCPKVAPVDAAPVVRVYVAGAVRNPGVYSMETGDRLVEGMEAAGGASDKADLEAVNLAMRVVDEGYYYIPAKLPQPAVDGDLDTRDDASPTPHFPVEATNHPATGSPPETTGPAAGGTQAVRLVNVNTATQSELETLPSIGPARARAIIAFREESGPFVSVEEITAVSGIGQGILNNLQGLITVEDSP